MFQNFHELKIRILDACEFVNMQMLSNVWNELDHVLKPWAEGWKFGVLGFDSRLGLGIFLFTTASRTALGPTQPPIHWATRTLSLRVKRPGREAHHSPPANAKVKNV